MSECFWHRASCISSNNDLNVKEVPETPPRRDGGARRVSVRVLLQLLPVSLPVFSSWRSLTSLSLALLPFYHLSFHHLCRCSAHLFVSLDFKVKEEQTGEEGRGGRSLLCKLTLKHFGLTDLILLQRASCCLTCCTGEPALNPSPCGRRVLSTEEEEATGSVCKVFSFREQRGGHVHTCHTHGAESRPLWPK